MKTVEVPKSCRTKITKIPEEQMYGIKVTKKQLQKFAETISSKYIDEVIPLKGPTQIIEGCPIEHAHEVLEHATYWITPEGSHGWCCEKCGYVFQWG
jgi:hypothetical protein